MAGTARRKIGRVINQQPAAWVVRLINERVAPREGEDGFDEWFGWLFCGAAVPGLPASRTLPRADACGPMP